MREEQIISNRDFNDVPLYKWWSRYGRMRMLRVNSYFIVACH